jgi:hypothetical protein
VESYETHRSESVRRKESFEPAANTRRSIR